VPRRLVEAARLGFRFALVPPGCGPDTGAPAPAGMQVMEVATVDAALHNAARASAG
jgi:DNA repair protein RadA/Sms